jgi:hypothetical protein
MLGRVAVVSLVAMAVAGRHGTAAAAARSEGQGQAADVRSEDQARTAEGDPHGKAQSTAEPSAEKSWYGWQIAIVDAGSMGLWVVARQVSGGGAAPSLLALTGTAGYLVGSPIIHGFQGRSAGVVGGSVALRLLMPILGLVVGTAAGQPAVARCEAQGSSQSDALAGVALCPFEALAYGVVGAGIGMVTASTIDVLALSWKPRRGPPEAPAGAGVSIFPMFGSARDCEGHATTTFGVRGSF